MKKLFILIFILFTIFSTDILAKKQSAFSFVQSFYKFHQSRDEAFSEEEVKARQKWFTPELFELFQHELKREAEYLKEYPTNKPQYGDGFPIAPFNECHVKGKEVKNVLKIGKISTKGNKTLVKIYFYMPKVCGWGLIHSYKVELVKNKSSWLISDFIYVDSNERLTNDLKREKY